MQYDVMLCYAIEYHSNRIAIEIEIEIEIAITITITMTIAMAIVWNVSC